MTVEISYFKDSATGGLPVAGNPGSASFAQGSVGGPNPGAPAQSVAITATPVLSGATPDGQKILSVIGTEAFRYEYSNLGRAAATATSNYVAAGERLWLVARRGFQFSLRTA